MKSTFFSAMLTIVLSGVLSFSSLNINAQEFRVGDKDLNLGLGVRSDMRFPSFQLTFDNGLRDDWGPGVFGIGGYLGIDGYRQFVGYNTTGWVWDDYGYVGTTLTFAFRTSYHYSFVKNLDTYAGTILGLSTTFAAKYGPWYTTDQTRPNGEGVGFVFDVFVGAKYYVSDGFSFYAEASPTFGDPFFPFSNHPAFVVGIGFKL